MFPPSESNQYGDFNGRTINSLEAYNRQVNTKLKIKTILLKFVKSLIEEENKMRISLYQSDKEPYYEVKWTKKVEDRLKNEEKQRQEMQSEWKLTLSNYLINYAEKIELDVVEPDENDEDTEERFKYLGKN